METNNNFITIDDFKKVEIRAGKILSVEKIENSEKLLKLSVDLGEENPRIILSGVAQYFPNIGELNGLICAFVTNLEPRKMMGIESRGMLLAVSGKSEKGDFLSVLRLSDDVFLGSLIK